MKPHFGATGENRTERTGGTMGTERRGDKGFTLLELMVATALFACATVAIALALQSSYRSDLHAQNWTIAYRAAQKVMEKHLSLDYIDLVALDNSAPASGIIDDFVVLCSPSETGYVLLEDIGALWGGPAQSAFRITTYVQNPEHGMDVRLVTVRTMY